MTWRRPMATPTISPAESTTTHNGWAEWGATGACFCIGDTFMLGDKRSLLVDLAASPRLSQRLSGPLARVFFRASMRLAHGSRPAASPGSVPAPLVACRQERGLDGAGSRRNTPNVDKRYAATECGYRLPPAA